MRFVRPDYDRDVGSFDRRARGYERSLTQYFFFGPIQWRVIDIAGPLPESATILDVGCGTGRLLRAAGRRWPNAQLVGVDPAAGMIEVARELNQQALFHVASGSAIPLPNDSVSVAFTTLSFHHWEDQAGGLKEIARVLRSGAGFILADVRLPAWVRRRVAHPLPPPPDALRNLFRQAGFTVRDQFRMMSGFIAVVHGIRT